MTVDKTNELESVYLRLCEKAPSLNKLSQEFGKLSLLDYIAEISPKKVINSASNKLFPLKTAFYQACYDYAQPLIGQEKSLAMLKALSLGVLNTANHMNVDTIGSYVQSNFLFGHMLQHYQPDNCVVPLLSATTVPLTNCTYPKGFVVKNEFGETLKFSLFKTTFDNHFVANAPALRESNVFKIKKTLKNSKDFYLKDTLLQILDNYYNQSNLLTLPTYSQQITVLNFKLSQALMPAKLFEFLYLPLEEIARKIILTQLSDETSLLYQMLFNTSAREAVLSTIAKDKLLPQTDFFWGIDAKGRKLYLKYDSGTGYTVKNPKNTTSVYINQTPTALQEALVEEKLVPTAYFSIMILVLSGEFEKIVGGFFQADYFLTLRQALCNFFMAINQPTPDLIPKIEPIYLCGPNFSGIELNKTIYSTGLIELIYAGGITGRVLQNQLNISLKNSQLLAIQELIYDLLPEMRSQSREKSRFLKYFIPPINIIYSR